LFYFDAIHLLWQVQPLYYTTTWSHLPIIDRFVNGGDGVSLRADGKHPLKQSLGGDKKYQASLIHH
jgi:hypothetical protein